MKWNRVERACDSHLGTVTLAIVGLLGSGSDPGRAGGGGARVIGANVGHGWLVVDCVRWRLVQDLLFFPCPFYSPQSLNDVHVAGDQSEKRHMARTCD